MTATKTTRTLRASGAALLLSLALATVWVAPDSAAAHTGHQIEGGPPPTTLTVNPGAFLNGRLRLELEHALRPQVSLFGGVHLLIREPVFAEPGGDLQGVGPDVGFRVFLTGTAPEGLFFGPMLSLSYLVSKGDVTGFGYAVTGMFGYTMILGGTAVLSFGLGLAYFDMVVERPNGDTVGILGVEPRARFAVGIAF